MVLGLRCTARTGYQLSEAFFSLFSRFLKIYAVMCLEYTYFLEVRSYGPDIHVNHEQS